MRKTIINAVQTILKDNQILLHKPYKLEENVILPDNKNKKYSITSLIKEFESSNKGHKDG